MILLCELVHPGTEGFVTGDWELGNFTWKEQMTMGDDWLNHQ